MANDIVAQKNWQRFKVSDVEESALISFDDIQIGMYETIGHPTRHRYQQQEDALIGFIMPAFLKLSDKAKQAVLTGTAKVLQDKYGMDEQGSTLNGTLAWKKGTTVYSWTINIGDSMSFIVILDATKAVKSIQRLNTLHEAKTPSKEEQQRIRKAEEQDISLYKGRLVKQGVVSLALTRAIGDNEFGKAVSHDPDISQIRFNLGPGEAAFLVVACDGLTEENALTPQAIAAIVSKYHDKPAVCAETLTQTAAAISTDNISTAVAPITSSIPVGIFVFDGHGGKEVSDNLGNHFYEQFYHVMLSYQK